MAGRKTILLTLAVLCFVCCNALVCENGYSLEITNFSNCAGPDGIIRLREDSAVVVHPDCSVSLQGCLEVKGYNTATGQVAVSKNGKNLINKSIDLCESSFQAKMLSNFLGAGGCPMNQREICASPNQKLRLARFLPMMRGSIAIEMRFTHDTGNSCIKIEAEVST